jgi:hypothetical protein
MNGLKKARKDGGGVVTGASPLLILNRSDCYKTSKCTSVSAWGPETEQLLFLFGMPCYLLLLPDLTARECLEYGR